MSRIKVHIYDPNQILDYQECIRRYDKIVAEFVPIITKVNIKESDDFDQWEEVNKQIQEKEKELKVCRDKKLLLFSLYDDVDIQDFKKKCTGNPKCPSSPLYHKKVPAPLKSKSVGSCEEGDRCNEETKLKTAAEEVEPEARDGVHIPNAVNLDGQVSVEPGLNKAGGEESRQEQKTPQTQVGPNAHGSSDGSDSKASEAIDDPHSDKPGEREAQPQAQSAAASPENGELDDPPSSASSQCSSKGDNDLTCALEETTVDADPILINPHHNNSLGSPDDKADAEVNGSKDVQGETVATETSDGLSSTEEGSASGGMGDSDSSPTDVKIEDTDSDDAAGRGNSNPLSVDAANRGERNNHCSTLNEGDGGTACSEEQVNALASPPDGGTLLDIIMQFFSQTPQREYIMMGLAPVALILLLTFLFKVKQNSLH
ncbi:hypothetical protein PVC01_010026500 [Plasmodium vivax]|uniref:VIR protein n=1 Tax=Plasmodium vivax TaxID=5855 RepID=A0A1G4H6N6_PLAVI|nr:hypothetical protein PVC01_010026500 [Plasmodium vivax]